MKQRYTITIADMEVNVISDGAPEAVETLVGMVDRKMREILLANRRCSKSEAALLCALDYCSDKLDAMRKQKHLEADLDAKDAELRAAEKELEAARKENDKLAFELETLRESLLAAQAQKRESELAAKEAAEPAPAIEVSEQISIADAIEKTAEAEAPAEVAATMPAVEAPAEVAVEAPAEAPEAPKEEIAPEDVEFDPTEIFRRAKANRSIRKGGKRKI